MNESLNRASSSCGFQVIMAAGRLMAGQLLGLLLMSMVMSCQSVCAVLVCLKRTHAWGRVYGCAGERRCAELVGIKKHNNGLACWCGVRNDGFGWEM